MARTPETVKARIGRPPSFYMILPIAFPLREGHPMLVPPHLLVISQGWGLIDLPLHATFSPAHPLARRDVPLTQARAFWFLFSLKGVGKLPFTARVNDLIQS